MTPTTVASGSHSQAMLDPAEEKQHEEKQQEWQEQQWTSGRVQEGEQPGGGAFERRPRSFVRSVAP